MDRLRGRGLSFGLLTMIVSLEAIFLSTFVMISQNRADAKRQVIADQQWVTVQEGQAERRVARPLQADPGADHGGSRDRAQAEPAGRPSHPMTNPQVGIFALGTAAHAYLELDLDPGRSTGVRRQAGVGGCASRGRRWAASTWSSACGPSSGAAAAPGDTPAGLAQGFERIRSSGLTGSRCRRPSTTPCSGCREARTTCLRRQRDRAIADLRGLATVAEETIFELAVPARPRSHRVHRRHREPDPGGGTRADRRPPPGRPGRRGDGAASPEVGTRLRRHGSRFAVERAGARDGRRKPDSVELDPKPADSHVASTDQDTVREDLPSQHALRDGHRPRNDVCRVLPRAGPARRDAREHERDHTTGTRDALTRFTRPRDGRVLLGPVDRIAPPRRRDLSAFHGECCMGRAGIEPATLGLRVPCSTS